MPLKNVYPSDRTWVYTQACGECKTRSATARQILQYLEKKPYGYDIIILKDDEEFGQMMAPTGSTGTDLFDDKDKKHALYRRLTGKISIDRPVVLWNPKFKFNYYSDVQGLEDNGPTEVNLKLIYSGKKVPYVMTYGKDNKEKARIICATSNFMPPEITLFHELGHVKQFFESYRYQWINFTDDLIRLEADNLARHEHPICQDFTIPVRAHYRHNALRFAPFALKCSTTCENAFRISQGATRIRDDTELKDHADKDYRIKEKDVPDGTLDKYKLDIPNWRNFAM